MNNEGIHKYLGLLCFSAPDIQSGIAQNTSRWRYDPSLFMLPFRSHNDGRRDTQQEPPEDYNEAKAMGLYTECPTCKWRYVALVVPRYLHRNINVCFLAETPTTRIWRRPITATDNGQGSQNIHEAAATGRKRRRRIQRIYESSRLISICKALLRSERNSQFSVRTGTRLNSCEAEIFLYLLEKM